MRFSDLKCFLRSKTFPYFGLEMPNSFVTFTLKSNQFFYGSLKGFNIWTKTYTGNVDFYLFIYNFSKICPGSNIALVC